MANSLISGKGTGWLRDRPDWRDYTLGTVRSELWDNGDRSKAKLWAPSPGLSNALPDSVDLRQWCSPIEDQGAIGSCTAFAGAGLVEYSMRRAFNIHVDVSPLFLYKTTRNVMGVTGDTGAWLRDMLKALVMCGVAPEDNWPYDAAKYDQEPSAFLYALGQNYQAVRYVRLDRPGMPGIAVLERIKTMLFAGFPAAFGFTVYDSIKDAGQTGEISFPQPGERVINGHAVDAVGFSDMRTIGNDRGALLIRNSWGAGWGEQGYGWMPYKYIIEGLAVDWWCILQQEWVDTGAFGEI